MNKAVEFKGIVRNLPGISTPDGTCHEILNMRFKDGAWRPVGKKKAGGQPVYDSDVKFIHTINENTKVIIAVRNNSLVYTINIDSEISGQEQTLIADITGMELSFAQLHNALMISDSINKTTIICVYDPENYVYRIFDEGFPEAPTIYTKSETNTEINEHGKIDSDSVKNLDADGVLGEGLKLFDKGLRYSPFGPIALRFAWELSDGSVIKHSAPYYIPETSIFSQAYTVDNNNNSLIEFYVEAVIKDLRLYTSTPASELTAIKNKYKGIIKSLNIYMTAQHSPVMKYERNNVSISEFVDNWQNPTDLELHRIIPGFNELSMLDELSYFIVHTIPLDILDDPSYLSTENATGDKSLLPGPFSDLATRETMPTDNFSHHRIHGNNLFAYNDRIFLSDITTNLYKGLPLEQLIEKAPGTVTLEDSYMVTFEVDIATASGTKTVSRFASFNWFYSKLGDGSDYTPSFQLKRMFAYPDSRATTLRIIVDPVTSGEPKLIATLKLTSNESLNFAWYNGISENIYGETIYGVFSLTDALSTFPAAVFSEEKRTYNDSNRIQATEFSNPFSYPAENSYRVGNGEVLGLSTNAIALSQGQFGQYPIYVFCSDGVWALGIGNGELLINTISPISRLVCNNPKSITPIDGGTVFTTAIGLHILTGATPIEISREATGQYLSPLADNEDYVRVASNPNLYLLKDYYCSVSLLKYLAGCIIAWDYINKELIVCNSAYKYSWVYSPEYKAWHKISQSWKAFIPDFPETYGYNDVSDYPPSGYYMDVLSEEITDGLMPIHIETRPLKLSTAKFKKIHRLLVEAAINEIGEYPFSVLLFGSADGFHWYALNASNIFKAQQSLVIGRSTHSCMYFILVIGGQTDNESYLSDFVVDFEERYNNKLR